MAQLQFKMGLHAALATATKKAGTVYVTTDEKAMYVDINDSTRIRLGDVIQVATVNELRNMAPEYDAQALYYVIDENALLKYTGDGSEHSWKQLNSTADIVEDLEALEDRVEEAEKDIVALNKELEGEEGVSVGLKARVGAVETELDGEGGVKTRLTATEGVANAAASAIGTANDAAAANGSLYARVKQNAADIADAKEDIGENASAITGLSTVVNGADGNGGLVKDVADLKQADTTINGLLGTKGDTKTDDTAFGRIAAVADRMNTAEGDIANLKGTTGNLRADVDGAISDITENANAIAALQTAVGTGTEGLATKVADLQGRMTTAEGEIDTAQSDITTIKGQITELQGADTQIKTDVQQNASDIAKVSEVANAAKTAIGDANSGLVKDVADLRAEDTAIKNAATALTGRVATAEGKITTAEGNITQLRTDVDANTSAIAKLNGGEEVDGSVAKQIKAVKEALQAEIDSDINAANAMNYIGSVKAFGELPTTGVKIGDTYVVSTGFTHEGKTYYAGDLLVAKGTEVNGVITSGLEWNHVETGYIEAHEAKLAGANNAITLTSHTATGGEVGDLGVITFAAEGAATVAVANNTVTIGMEWGTF